jgi:myosin-1
MYNGTYLNRNVSGVDFTELNRELRGFFARQTKPGEVDDLVLETDSTDINIVAVLGRRFQNNEMYTSIGPVLIAVNPYQKLIKGGMSIYAPEFALHFYQHAAYEVAPHIYRIGADAYRQLVQDRTKQCIIISGESGAGQMLLPSHSHLRSVVFR